MVMEGDLTLGDGHTMQCTHVPQKCTVGTYIILLTANVTPVNLI